LCKELSYRGPLVGQISEVFSEELIGKDAIELGCGTAYISAWLSQRGVRAVGVDNSEAQLRTARRLQRQYGLDFPLIHGNAEGIPYPDASFDFAISEYGACLWADPQRWIPEAGRSRNEIVVALVLERKSQPAVGG
jgi:ubiquinone/menaquinone biosynthesis C-methylase UbiE